MGLRERKKEQTRQRLTETAWRLAADRGFDHVTVAEIAREADVSEATLFNYFRTKEDLFYAPLEAFGDRLIDAVRDREPGASPLSAVREFLLQSHGPLAQFADEVEAREQLLTQFRVINESPALLAREQRAFTRYTEDLATLLVEEEDGRDPFTAAVIAHALIGIHRSLIGHVRQGVLSGRSLRRLDKEVRDQGTKAFELLGSGLDSYGIAERE